MTCARNRRLALYRALGCAALVALWAVACGGPQELGGQGSVCFRADDCHAGLACVPESKGSTRLVCSPDLSGIVSMVDGAPPDAPGMGGAASLGGAAAGGYGGKAAAGSSA